MLQKMDIIRKRLALADYAAVEVTDDRYLAIDMKAALDQGNFELHYQPIWGIPDNRMIGFEALIRWNHPTLGTISPAEFIPVAEENGMICEIGAWVLKEACRTAATWPDDLFVAVNVSSVQFRSHDTLALVRKLLDTYRLDPRRLKLEITETAMIEGDRNLVTILSELRAMGIRIALDDFGTGFSSLSHLHDLKFDCIKIDRSFINNLEHDQRDQAIVRAITDMARAFSVTTVAEGAETPGQLALLKWLGCDSVQGYLLGKPENRLHTAALIEMHQSMQASVKLPTLTSGLQDKAGQSHEDGSFVFGQALQSGIAAPQGLLDPAIS
jgi:EAL domain-containing protein (putative c-di-GMP-specific phosphodiesterase class I)